MATSSWPQRARLRLQHAIVPEVRLTQYLYHEALGPFLARNPLWLDLGCGRELIPKWFRPDYYEQFTKDVSQASMIVGLDYDESSLRDSSLACRLRGDMQALPFPDQSFDLVTANMVVEHLDNPQPCLREIKRVLKPSGVFVFHTPNLESPLIALQSVFPDFVKKGLIHLLEDRADEDVFRAYYRLNTVNAIRKHAECSGLRVKDLKTFCGGPISAVLGPLAVFELLVIRALRKDTFARLRPGIIAVLEAP